MRLTGLIAVVSCALFTAACAPPPLHHAVAPVVTGSPLAVKPAGLTPDQAICEAVKKVLRPVKKAVSSRDTHALVRYDMKLSRWTSAAFKAHDVTFANALGDAAAKVGVVALPYGSRYERGAIADLNKVRHYCTAVIVYW